MFFLCYNLYGGKMKKVIVFLTILLIYINVQAFNKGDKINVTLNKCVDGDTATFNYKGETIKVRFLAIDTPELKDDKKKINNYGNEAKEFTCDKLKSAKKISIEFDKNSDLQDKYGRYLGWIWIDGKLLQEEIIENGYAKVAYLYNDYKYTNELKIAESKAKDKKLHIWSETKDLSIYQIILIIILVILIVILKPRKKKKYKKKLKIKNIE